MDDTDGKTGINIDEDDQVASSNSDYDYEGIFSYFFSLYLKLCDEIYV
jgi:hypothetical protein